MASRCLIIVLIAGIIIGATLSYAATTMMLNQSDPYAKIATFESQINQLNKQVEDKNSQIAALQSQIKSIRTKSVDLIAVSFPRIDDTSHLIRTWIGRANTTIDVAIYSFTQNSIADALVTAKTRGVRVRVLMELDNINDDGSEYQRLLAAGVDIKGDSSSGLMHDKFFVIDGRVVGTGSYNWTSTAENDNAENLVIFSSESLASKYLNEFNHLWD